LYLFSTFEISAVKQQGAASPDGAGPPATREIMNKKRFRL